MKRKSIDSTGHGGKLQAADLHTCLQRHRDRKERKREARSDKRMARALRTKRGPLYEKLIATDKSKPGFLNKLRDKLKSFLGIEAETVSVT